MAEGNSPKGSAGVFAKKVQRQLSRSKEKVLQKLGKAVETRDDQFEYCIHKFNDQQTDGSRIYKDLKIYLNAVREMREASRRLSQSLFDAYEGDWAGEDDLGAIVEGEDLLWNDYEVKLLDQAIRTMESYVSQFPDVRERIAKRGRKLVDYDSTRHHLGALQTAKKRDDVKITKAEEEMNIAKAIYEGINNELKDELPALFDSRIGCYVSVFSSISNLRDTFFKEMTTFNHDLQNVMRELKAQHPDNSFAVRPLQRFNSLQRRSLMSPKSWKAGFSEFPQAYSPKRGPPKSPYRPRFDDTLSRDSSLAGTLADPAVETGDVDADSIRSSPAEAKPVSDKEDTSTGAAGEELKSGEEDTSLGGEGKDEKEEEEAEPEPSSDHQSVASDTKGEGENPPLTESSSGLNNSQDTESLELQLSAADSSPLYIEETVEDPGAPEAPRSNGLENGDVPAVDSEPKGLEFSQKDVPVENQVSANSKSTAV